MPFILKYKVHSEKSTDKMEITYLVLREVCYRFFAQYAFLNNVDGGQKLMVDDHSSNLYNSL